mmetsp:Transcript_5350/g.7918  ORF Transcript_5350/g.7918 Transcript_5350/m.7918 type:complete len:342 (-) Transcript_5350:2843-3868(-)
MWARRADEVVAVDPLGVRGNARVLSRGSIADEAVHLRPHPATVNGLILEACSCTTARAGFAIRLAVSVGGTFRTQVVKLGYGRLRAILAVAKGVGLFRGPARQHLGAAALIDILPASVEWIGFCNALLFDAFKGHVAVQHRYSVIPGLAPAELERVSNKETLVVVNVAVPLWTSREITALSEHVDIRAIETSGGAAPILVRAHLAAQFARRTGLAQTACNRLVTAVAHARSLIGCVCRVSDLPQRALACFDHKVGLKRDFLLPFLVALGGRGISITGAKGNSVLERKGEVVVLARVPIESNVCEVGLTRNLKCSPFRQAFSTKESGAKFRLVKLKTRVGLV